MKMERPWRMKALECRKTENSHARDLELDLLRTVRLRSPATPLELMSKKSSPSSSSAVLRSQGPSVLMYFDADADLEGIEASKLALCDVPDPQSGCTPHGLYAGETRTLL